MFDIALNVLVWNDRRYLPGLLHSLRQLSYPSLRIRILDQGSTDGSLEYLREHASDFLAFSLSKNIGFAAGHNQLIRLALRSWQESDLSSKIILAVNADMILDNHLLHFLLSPFSDASVGATQPKIFRAFHAKEEDSQPHLSHILDTTGLVLGRGWRMEDRGAGQEDLGAYDAHVDLLGPAGALPCYRASALVDTAEKGEDGKDEFFDESFFAYREDCDLALRLKRRGWKTVFCPEAHVWHFRGMYGAQNRTLFQRLSDRLHQPRHSAAYSTRNQLFFLVKQFPFAAWRFLPYVLFHEGGRVLYGLLFESFTRRVLFASLTTFPKMFTKRQVIFEKSKLSWNELRLYVQR